MFRFLVAALATPLLALSAPVEMNVQKRTPGRATYYAVGQGACGSWNVPSDFIVALNAAQFETGGYPSSQCGRGITINYNGMSAHATVMDECPAVGCSYGDLDMSEGLFTFFAPTSVGVFYMDWSFDGEDGSGSQPTTQAPAPPPPPPTTTTPAWTPDPTTSTSIYVPPPPPPPTTTTQPVVTEQAVETTTAPPEPTSNNDSQSGGVFAAVNMAAVHFANLIYAAQGA